MLNSIKKTVLIVFITTIVSVFYFANAKGVDAQTCGGSVECCTELETVYTPRGCSPSCRIGDSSCTRCTGTSSQCRSTNFEGCAFRSGVCGHNACAFGIVSGNCRYTAPTPTPGSGGGGGGGSGGGGGGGGSSCSGDCFTGIANCGAVGRPNGSGSCSNGGLCCNPPGGGGGGGPSLVRCDLRVSGGRLSDPFSIGEMRAISFAIWGTDGDRAGQFQYLTIDALDPAQMMLSNNTGSLLWNTRNRTGFPTNTIYLYGVSPGTARIRGRVYSRRCSSCPLEIACSATVSTSVVGAVATNTPTPRPNTPTPSPRPTNTPGPGVCQTPPPRDPPAPSCATSGQSNGSVTWRWDAVPGANQYEVDIVNASNNSVRINNPFRAASTYGCAGGGLCQYTTSNLPSGNYFSRIRAVGPACTASAFSQSNAVRVNTCGIFATATPTSPPAPGPNVTLRANGSTGTVVIPYNTAATLSWTTSNVTSCTAGGSWSGSRSTSGSQTTGNLINTRTYSLTCTGPGGTRSSSVTVQINAPAVPVVDLRANGVGGSITAPYNSASTLSWTSNNVNSCTASGGWSGARAVSGSQSTGNLTSTRTYSLTCSGTGGTASDTVTINMSCTPNCGGAQCGQADGCGGLCGDSGNNTPPAPTVSSPTDGAEVQAVRSGSNYVVTLRVQAGGSGPSTGLTHFQVYPVGESCTHPQGQCTSVATTSPVTTYTFTIPNGQYGREAEFQWRAWHQSNLCSRPISAATPWQTFTLVDEISGRVLLDDGIAGLSGGKCISPFSPVGTFVEGGELITVSRAGQNYTTSLNGDGSYSITVPISSEGDNTVSYSTTSGSDRCGCPEGCNYTDVDSPETALNFYYQFNRDPWWQIRGGHIYAGRRNGYAVVSLVPDTCIGDCQRILMLRDEQNTVNSSGAILTGGGRVDTLNDDGEQVNQIDEDGRNLRALGTTFDGIEENYAYFYRLFSMGVSPSVDIGAPGNALKPTTPPANGRAYFVNGNMRIQQPWTVTAGESIVVFVENNLVIENAITVEDGGFLSFIVQGNITVGQDVCTSGIDDTASIMDGVYIADGLFTVSSRGGGDCRFVGEGTFVGWQGISIPRDYRDGGVQEGWNSRNPTELFRYRPDFVVNAPERMKRPMYQWQEISPQELNPRPDDTPPQEQNPPRDQGTGQ